MENVPGLLLLLLCHIKKIIEMELKLHEAMQIVLKETGRSMSYKEIADEINKRELYHRKKDNNPVPPEQISIRAYNYPSLFEKEGSLVKLISR